MEKGENSGMNHEEELKVSQATLGEQSPRNNENKWEMEFHKEKKAFG